MPRALVHRAGLLPEGAPRGKGRRDASSGRRAWTRRVDRHPGVEVALSHGQHGNRSQGRRGHGALLRRVAHDQDVEGARRSSGQQGRSRADVAPAAPPARRERLFRGRSPSAPARTSRPGRQRAHGSASAPNHHQPRQPPLRTRLPTHSRNRPRAGEVGPEQDSTVESRMEPPRRTVRATVTSSRKAGLALARLLSARAQNRREYVDGAPGRGVQRFESRGSHRSWKASARPS